MNNELESFTEVIHFLSEKYNVPYEVVESIITEWVRILYRSIHEENEISFEF